MHDDARSVPSAGHKMFSYNEDEEQIGEGEETDDENVNDEKNDEKAEIEKQEPQQEIPKTRADRVNRWSRDLYNAKDQAPKSRDYLVYHMILCLCFINFYLFLRSSDMGEIFAKMKRKKKKRNKTINPSNKEETAECAEGKEEVEAEEVVLNKVVKIEGNNHKILMKKHRHLHM
jgi:hypothetical protein